MMKKNIIFIIFLFYFIFIAVNVLAVGIGSMSGTTNDAFVFQPDLEKIYTYFVRSNTDRPMNHMISVGGDLAPYVSLDKNVIYLVPRESKNFNAMLKLPQELEPGWHTAYVCAAEGETRGGAAGEGASIGTKVAVCAVIRVLSLYPEPLANFEFSAPDVTQGEIATFTLRATSLSKQDMEIKGVVDIYAKESNAKITTLHTDEKLLKAGVSEDLKVSLDTTGFVVGEYIANATLYFADNQSTQEKSFRIGTLFIDILSFTNKTSAGKINPINVEIESKWNSEVDNVYVTAYIKDIETKEKEIATFSSPRESIKAWEKKNITAYWDTNNVSAGNYYAKVVLHYEGKTSEREGTITVTPHLEMPSTTTMALILVLIIVVVVLVIVIVRTRKKLEQATRTKSKKRDDFLKD